IPNIDKVNSVDIEIDGRAYRMEIKRANNTNNDEEVIGTYYMNGKEVQEEDFKKVYQNMISAKYDAELKEDIKTDDNTKSHLTIKYNISGDVTSSYQVSFLSYKDSFYLVDTGKKIEFLADKRQIDNIAQSIKDLLD
ncbi:MAG: hypothetical protein GX915_04420, partial [Clostridiales bacterium]|nr:hypothetical protein [Clostridiales bacterium]